MRRENGTTAAIAAVVAVFAVATPAGAERIERSLDERFPVAEGEVLRLHHGDGDLVVVPWDRPEVTVEVEYRAVSRTIGWGGDTELDLTVRRGGDEHVVRVDERRSTSIGFVTFRRERFDVRVQAPPWLALVLEGDDGDVELAGWAAPVTVRLDDGDVDLRDLGAGLTLDIADGDARIERLSGALRATGDDGDLELFSARLSEAVVRVEDGDIEITDARIGELKVASDDGAIVLREVDASRLDVRTEDGRVAIDLVGPPAPQLAVRSDDGPVRISLPQDVSAAVRVVRDDGRVTLERIEATLEEARGGRELRAVLGAGAGRIDIGVEDARVVLTGR